MTQQRNPNNSEKCFFHIQPTSVLTADESITQCVKCITYGNQRLQSLKEDFHQIAYEAILKAKPEYNQSDQRGASFTTFIRSRVCGILWNARREALKRATPFPIAEAAGDTVPFAKNLLVDALVAEACQRGGVDERVICCVEVEQFKRLLPQLLTGLSERERRALKLRFFEEIKVVETAEVLGVTKGRVSQLIDTAFTKLKKAYLNASQQQRNG